MPLNKLHNEPYSRYFAGSGEMAQLTRSFNWAGTALGSPDGWPQSLLTTLSIILNSKFPMFLFWGPELICFYNDAYRPSLGNNGKHPAVGLRAEDTWPEIWAFIKPLIDRVMGGGEATWSEDQLLPIYRNGNLEDVYWTFSYSPVYGELGTPAGVFVTCTETTEKVRSLKEISRSKEDLEFALDAAELGAWDLNPVTNKFTGNDRLKSWFGLEPNDEILLPLATNVIAEKDRQKVVNAILAALQYSSGGNYHVEYTIINPKDNREIIVRAKGKALFNDDKIAYRFSGTLEDITGEKKSRTELEKLTVSLRQAIETAHMGTWNVNLVNDELRISERTAVIHGIPAGSILTFTQYLGMIDPIYRNKVKDGITYALQNASDFDMEYLIHPMDESAPKWLRSTGRGYYNTDGLPVSISGTILDITERKQDDQRKNDFIGMVSHELKTPLTSLKGYIQMLHAKAAKEHDSFRINALSKADVQVNKMSAMINGFLNVSRLESGQIYLNKQHFNLNALLQETIDEILIFTSSHTITLLPHEVIDLYADRDKIGYVLTNLLSNAIKYSPHGDLIEVSCGLTNNQAHVSVKDEGMGIKPQDKDKLFERYYRVENNHTKLIAGFGIGLYLSAEIIQRHNGRIWVDSEQGEGSIFHFSLPVSL